MITVSMLELNLSNSSWMTKISIGAKMMTQIAPRPPLISCQLLKKIKQILQKWSKKLYKRWDYSRLKNRIDSRSNIKTGWRSKKQLRRKPMRKINRRSKTRLKKKKKWINRIVNSKPKPTKLWMISNLRKINYCKISIKKKQYQRKRKRKRTRQIRPRRTVTRSRVIMKKILRKNQTKFKKKVSKK